MKTQWKDISCVKAACDELGYKLKDGGVVRYYYGQGEVCDYTIEFGRSDIAAKYNAGLKKNSKGYYDFIIDNSIHGAIITDTRANSDGKVRTGGKTTDLVNDLQTHYSINVVKKIAKKNGYRMRVDKEKTSQGYTKIKLMA
jgi:hypothetical protein